MKSGFFNNLVGTRVSAGTFAVPEQDTHIFEIIESARHQVVVVMPFSGFEFVSLRYLAAALDVLKVLIYRKLVDKWPSASSCSVPLMLLLTFSCDHVTLNGWPARTVVQTVRSRL